MSKQEFMKLIELNIQRIFELCRLYKVKSLAVFGSILTDRFNEHSDVDMLVDFEPIDHDRFDYVSNYFSFRDALEERYNKGKQSNLHFYRENSGREADIIRIDGDKLVAYEVKSSQTFNKSFVRNLNYLKDLLGDSLKDTYVVYDGDYIPPNIINIRNITKVR